MGEFGDLRVGAGLIHSRETVSAVRMCEKTSQRTTSWTAFDTMDPVRSYAHDFLGNEFHSFELDVAHSRAVVQMVDGRRISLPLTTLDPGDTVAMARMVYSPAAHKLTIFTLAGECAVMEIEPPGGIMQRAGRRIAYLDQCHWSTLARRISDPDSVTRADDAVAADKLISWARNQRVILPLSSGHMVETTPLYGAKRQSLALAMFELSRGWIMRNPLHVRRDEIAWVVGNAGPGTPRRDRPEVFTLQPDGFYAESILAGSDPQPTGVHEYLDWLGTRLSVVAANFDLLMEPDRITPVKTSGWCDDLAALGRDPQFRALPTARRRIAAQGRALIDALLDLPVLDLIQQSGLEHADAVAALLRGLQSSTDTMPFLRLFADALGERLLNPTTRWEPNDLIDMMYLACAAAYADGVAAERRATRYLNLAWQDRSGACPVVTTLSELVARLTDLGVE